MTQRSRDSRREAARSREGARGPGWLLPGLGGLVVVVGAALIAIALSGSGDGGSSARPTDLPGSVTGASAAAVRATDPAISGLALPVYGDPSSDTAVGQAIPTVTAAGGSIALDGRAKILIFLAHWCSHCQAEVPVVQAWLNAGGLPEDVDLVSVSTAIDPNRPNYPPEDWLAREGWTPPVIVDPTGAVADAYGLSAFPYFVFVRADGTVGARATGELDRGPGGDRGRAQAISLTARISPGAGSATDRVGAAVRSRPGGRDPDHVEAAIHVQDLARDRAGQV